MDKFSNGQFWNPANHKDRIFISECEDIWARRVLEFLFFILYLEIPTQVIVTFGNKVFGELFGDRSVGWGLVIQIIVEKVAKGVGKNKATLICPYLFHLHQNQEVLKPGEIVARESNQVSIEWKAKGGERRAESKKFTF